jgi:hypothetical protein
MILYMRPGEASSVPDALFDRCRDQADINLLALVQCYIRYPLQWQILAGFCTLRYIWCSPAEIAEHIGCDPAELWPDLEDLTRSSLLEQRILAVGPYYRLTTEDERRQQALRLGLRWSSAALSPGS